MARIPRLCVTPEQLAGDELRLAGPTARRLRSVLRRGPGAQLRLFDGAGRERAARILEGGERGEVLVALGAEVEASPEPPVPVVLACALPRGNRGDWLVEKATELGVAAIEPLETTRSVLKAGGGRIERWRRVAVEAAEQCGRAVVPRIEVPSTATSPATNAVIDLLADPSGVLDIATALACDDRPAERVRLVVGPEGGWSAEELEARIAAGARLVQLGPRTLRVETAALVGLSQVLAATGGLAVDRVPD